jgi:hypothetical protein
MMTHRLLLPLLLLLLGSEHDLVLVVLVLPIHLARHDLVCIHRCRGRGLLRLALLPPREHNLTADLDVALVLQERAGRVADVEEVRDDGCGVRRQVLSFGLCAARRLLGRRARPRHGHGGLLV